MRTEGRPRAGAGPGVGTRVGAGSGDRVGVGTGGGDGAGGSATVGSDVEGSPEQSYAFPIGPLIRRVSPPAYRTWYLRHSSGVGCTVDPQRPGSRESTLTRKRQLATSDALVVTRTSQIDIVARWVRW